VFFVSFSHLEDFMQHLLLAYFSHLNHIPVEIEGDFKNRRYIAHPSRQSEANFEIRFSSIFPYLLSSNQQAEVALTQKMEDFSSFLASDLLFDLEEDTEVTHRLLLPYLSMNAALPNLPSEVFEYCQPMRYLDSKKRQEIAFLDPSTFNDPFDCDFEALSPALILRILASFPSLKKSVSSSQLATKLLQNVSFVNQLNLWIEKQLANFAKTPEAFERGEKELEASFPSFEEYVFPFITLPVDFVSWRHYIINNLIQLLKTMSRLRVLCTSRVYDSILMWSYYADKHQGVCIGHRLSDIQHSLASSSIPGICVYDDVHYSSTRPIMPFRHSVFTFKGANNYFLLLYSLRYTFTKFIDWHHEKEFRFAIFASSPLPSPLLVTCLNSRVYRGCRFHDTYILPCLAGTNIQLNKDDIKYKLK
jgi:hypothetical protein